MQAMVAEPRAHDEMDSTPASFASQQVDIIIEGFVNSMCRRRPQSPRCTTQTTLCRHFQDVHYINCSYSLSSKAAAPEPDVHDKENSVPAPGATGSRAKAAPAAALKVRRAFAARRLLSLPRFGSEVWACSTNERFHPQRERYARA